MNGWLKGDLGEIIKKILLRATKDGNLWKAMISYLPRRHDT